MWLHSNENWRSMIPEQLSLLTDSLSCCSTKDSSKTLHTSHSVHVEGFRVSAGWRLWRGGAVLHLCCITDYYEMSHISCVSINDRVQWCVLLWAHDRDHTVSVSSCLLNQSFLSDFRLSWHPEHSPDEWIDFTFILLLKPSPKRLTLSFHPPVHLQYKMLVIHWEWLEFSVLLKDTSTI